MAGEINTVRGVVRALAGDRALIEVEQGGCGRCHEEGGCGGQQLTQMFCSGPKSYEVANTCDARVGDRVVVGIAPGNIRRTANLAYGVPLTAAIAGAAIGTAVHGDPGGMAGALLGLVLAFIIVRRRASAAGSGNAADRPYIVSRS